MKMINCSCLVNVKDNKILLVRVRDNELWYLPGGKIEKDEDPKDTLIRELKEELHIDLIPDSITYIDTVVAPAYREDANVKLICFSADWTGEIVPCLEVTEVQWVEKNNYFLFAPAVLKAIESGII